jgi:hypothetical protein
VALDGAAVVRVEKRILGDRQAEGGQDRQGPEDPQPAPTGAAQCARIARRSEDATPF